MSLSGLNDPSAVLRAIAECDDLGQTAFLAKHGFRPAKGYFLVHEGRHYDSKAIAGVAANIQHPDRTPLRGSDFSGGDATVRRKLEELGFKVVSLDELSPPEQSAASGSDRPTQHRSPSEAKVDRSTDMLLVAYALSRLGEHRQNRSDGPPVWLNAGTWEATYDLFFPQLGAGRKAQAFRSSLKNARDMFDPHSPTNRRGWLTPEGEAPEPVGWVRQILDVWGTRSDLQLQAAVLEILQRSAPAVAEDVDWPQVRRRLERMTRQTVQQSGKVQKRMLKNKELRCKNLEGTLDDLFSRQAYRCAQTGVAFVESDPELRASLDRIDSDGHYEDGSLGDGAHNLQLVTHWYNIAKGIRSDAEMRRLIAIHATDGILIISRPSDNPIAYE